jgi:hypothetical protein
MARPSSLIPLSPVLLVASANALAAMPPARRWGDGGVEFVHLAGRHSHYDVRSDRSSWPIPVGDSCAALARFAEGKGVLSVEPPAVGDVFLAWSPYERRYTSSGIVELVKHAGTYSTGLWYFDCRTIEGFPRPRRPHDEVKKEKRKLSPACGDRFVRWADLDARGAVSDPLSREQVELATVRQPSAA